jgi:hypothetical protein
MFLTDRTSTNKSHCPKEEAASAYTADGSAQAHKGSGSEYRWFPVMTDPGPTTLVTLNGHFTDLFQAEAAVSAVRPVHADDR